MKLILLNKLCNTYLEKSSITLYISNCHYLTSIVTNNPFITPEQKDNILLIIYKIKKHYNAFKLLEFYLHKKLHIKSSTVEYDLSYTLLSEYTKDKKIDIIENDVIYIFYIPDIIKIIMNAIIYHEALFSNPILPKNPHTNLPFSFQNLYNIYFKLIDSQFTIPILIQYFYRSEFNITTFKTNCETILREKHLETYYKSFSLDEKYDIIITMLLAFKPCCYKLKIHSSFSKISVVNTFQSLLYYYSIVQYSYSPSKKLNAKNKIKQFLKHFQNNNPFFGRIKYNNCYVIT